jgi:hypothetical protein
MYEGAAARWGMVMATVCALRHIVTFLDERLAP